MGRVGLDKSNAVSIVRFEQSIDAYSYAAWVFVACGLRFVE